MAKTLAEIALDEGLLDRKGLDDAARLADADDIPLVVALVRRAGVGEVALVGAIRRQARVALADPVSIKLDADAVREVPREVCARRRVLPLGLRVPAAGPRAMRLAMADPTDQVAIAEVEHLTGCQVEPHLMTLSAVEELIDSAYRGFVTKVMKRGQRDTGPVTAPHHRVSDEADALLRVRALVRLLVDKEILSEDEYEVSVRDLLKRRDPDS